MAYRTYSISLSQRRLSGESDSRQAVSITAALDVWNQVQAQPADVMQSLLAERRTIISQQKMFLLCGGSAALASAVLLLFSFHHGLTLAPLQYNYTFEMSGIGTGISSGTFGWIIRVLHRRLAAIDRQNSRDREMRYLIACSLMIDDIKLRNRTLSRFSEAVARNPRQID